MSSPDRSIPLLRRGRWHYSKDTYRVTGGPYLSLAPEIMVRDDAARARMTNPAPLAPADRITMLRVALELFQDGLVPVEGLGPQSGEQFAAAMRASAGLPPVLVRRWSRQVRECLDESITPEPDDAALELVSLPANTFTCLEAVIEALLGAGRVWIRPSRREPLSAARLVGALLAAGWPADRLGLYPTVPEVLPALIEVTTRQVVYGGDAVDHLAGPSLRVRGPGRACAVVGSGAEPTRLADRMAGDAGRFCTNVSVIVGEGDTGPVAREVAEILDGIEFDPTDRRWPLASVPESHARQVAEFLTGRLGPGSRMLTRRPLISRAGGRTFLAPTLLEVDHADHPLVGCELPFPFAVALSTSPAGVRGIVRRSGFVYAEPAAR